MLSGQEINVLFHILDSVGPDLERKEYGRYEMKPAGYREYVEGISLSVEEYGVFIVLKEKIRRALLGGLFAGRGE